VPTRINSFIEEENPDIISFQEYKTNPKISLDAYEYSFEHLEQEAKIGQVIVSKFPIVNSGSVEFPNTNNNAIYVDIIKNTDTVRIYNIHLQSLHISADMSKLKAGTSDILMNKTRETFKIQQEQAELFLKHRNQSSYKTIITGDFNNTAYSYVYKHLKGDFNDAFELAGNGFGRTFDFKFFPIRIDFIFSDTNFEVNGFKTYHEKFSDHYPIMAKLSLH
jgi:endonuclease/exonuclease/phosphatase family metal-dependent hydrolase